MHRKIRANGAWLLMALSLFLAACSSAVHAQCTADSAADAEILRRFNQEDWSQVVQLAGQLATPLSARSADANFALGMSLAHLQRWQDAQTALLTGHRQCPRQERFAVELAGIAFELKHYPQAAQWLRRALRLNPRDEYANSFAGVVYMLMGNVNAALMFWNRVQKPSVVEFHFDPHLQVQRLILDRAFAFSPAATLDRHDYETTEARLDALGIFPSYKIVLTARSDEKFDVDFHATELNRFGAGWLQALVSTFSGAAYETIYPAYYNINGSATNIESLLRWDSQKRRAWISYSAPLHNLPQLRGALEFDARDENWVIRNSFTGPAPVLGAFDLERQSAGAHVSGIPNGRLQWRAGAELAHRSFHGVVSGATLAPALVESGFDLKAVGSVQGKLLDVPERRFTVTAGASTELARVWPAQNTAATHAFAKLQAAATAHWIPPAEGDAYEVQQRVRVGRIFQNAPIDELYLLGMERDTDLWLRGHVGTRDGRKGSSPLASNYFLANSDFFRRIYGNGLITIKAGPLLDIARATAPASGLATGQWFADAGAQAKITVLGTSVVFTWGHDLRSGNNAFYGTAAHR